MSADLDPTPERINDLFRHGIPFGTDRVRVVPLFVGKRRSGTVLRVVVMSPRFNGPRAYGVSDVSREAATNRRVMAWAVRDARFVAMLLWHKGALAAGSSPSVLST